MTQPTSLPLAAVLDTAAAGPLRQSLRKMLGDGKGEGGGAAGAVVVDGSMVDRAGLACLQVLAAAKAGADRAGLDFRITNPSAALADMAALGGLGDLVANRA